MKTLALDIGGANLKAAHSAAGRWQARSTPFALWKQPGYLAERLIELACDAPPFDRVLVTMTAELCDCFATKREGVLHVLHAVELMAGGRIISVWQTGGGFAGPDQVRADPLPCAASNWHALATFVAQRHREGCSLLMDTGSTTTDIILLQSGRPVVRGLTDTERLASGELVYTGALRTSLASFGQAITWHGVPMGVMAETFATIGDVHLLLGHLPEDASRTDTADGRPMTRDAAAGRIARMIGADLEALSQEDARELAGWFDAAQQAQVVAAVRQVIGRRKPARVILAGSGDFVAAQAAAVALPGVETLALAAELGPEVSAAACAYALLHLEEAGS